MHARLFKFGVGEKESIIKSLQSFIYDLRSTLNRVAPEFVFPNRIEYDSSSGYWILLYDADKLDALKPLHAYVAESRDEMKHNPSHCFLQTAFWKLRTITLKIFKAVSKLTCEEEWLPYCGIGFDNQTIFVDSKENVHIFGCDFEYLYSKSRNERSPAIEDDSVLVNILNRIFPPQRQNDVTSLPRPDEVIDIITAMCSKRDDLPSNLKSFVNLNSSKALFMLFNTNELVSNFVNFSNEVIAMFNPWRGIVARQKTPEEYELMLKLIRSYNELSHAEWDQYFPSHVNEVLQKQFSGRSRSEYNTSAIILDSNLEGGKGFLRMMRNFLCHCGDLCKDIHSRKEPYLDGRLEPISDILVFKYLYSKFQRLLVRIFRLQAETVEDFKSLQSVLKRSEEEEDDGKKNLCSPIIASVTKRSVLGDDGETVDFRYEVALELKDPILSEGGCGGENTYVWRIDHVNGNFMPLDRMETNCPKLNVVFHGKQTLCVIIRCTHTGEDIETEWYGVVSAEFYTKVTYGEETGQCILYAETIFIHPYDVNTEWMIVPLKEGGDDYVEDVDVEPIGPVFGQKFVVSPTLASEYFPYMKVKYFCWNLDGGTRGLNEIGPLETCLKVRLACIVAIKNDETKIVAKSFPVGSRWLAIEDHVKLKDKETITCHLKTPRTLMFNVTSELQVSTVSLRLAIRNFRSLVIENQIGEVIVEIDLLSDGGCISPFRALGTMTSASSIASDALPFSPGTPD